MANFTVLYFSIESHEILSSLSASESSLGWKFIVPKRMARFYFFDDDGLLLKRITTLKNCEGLDELNTLKNGGS